MTPRGTAPPGRGALVALTLLVLLAALSLLAPAPAGARADGPAARDWQPPVPGEVVHLFDPPARPWLAGNRGVDLAAAPGEAVQAPSGGVVTFAGQVGGKPVVVVTHGPLRSTLEPVEATVPTGSVVRVGDVVGVLGTPPGTPNNPDRCAPRSCLHWGVRRGDVYLDPLALLGRAAPIVLLA